MNSNQKLGSFLGGRSSCREALWWLAFVVCATGMASSVLAQQQRQLLSSSRLLLGTEANLSAAVRAGDVDGDGDLDLIVANGRHWPQQNMLFLNQSRGRFNVARPLGLDRCTSYACEFADLDGDGDLDIAVANDNAPCLVFLNSGKGKFVRHGAFGMPSSVRSLAVADIDRDGDVDLLVNCRGRPNRIHFNDGKARFDKSVTFGTSRDSTIDVAVADLNEDGHNDLILANRDAQPNTILLATGAWKSAESKALFQKPKSFGGGKDSSRAVEVADFNSDGHVDWVIGNIGSANIVYLGNGKGGVLRQLAIGSKMGRTYCLAVGDLNQDGRPDVVAGNVGQPNAAYINEAGGARFIHQPFGKPDSATYGVCVADLNGDGFSDVAVANSGQQNRIYLNQPKRK